MARPLIGAYGVRQAAPVPMNGQQAVERGLLPVPGLQQRRGVVRVIGNPPILHPRAQGQPRSFPAAFEELTRRRSRLRG
jgi:hypothetical protein